MRGARRSPAARVAERGQHLQAPDGVFRRAAHRAGGLKGFSVGGAQVSEKHAGFVINRGGATCADVRALIGEVQRRVQERAGVLLEPEVKFVEK